MPDEDVRKKFIASSVRSYFSDVAGFDRHLQHQALNAFLDDGGTALLCVEHDGRGAEFVLSNAVRNVHLFCFIF